MAKLKFPGLLQDLQHHCRRGQRQRQADEQGLTPTIGQSQHDRGENDRRDGDLRTAKAENGTAHGPQAPWLELEPDHEQK